MTIQVLLTVVIRAALQAIGGTAVYVSDGDIAQIAGAVTILATLAWSLYEKKKAEPK